MHDERVIHYRNVSEEVIPRYGIIETAGVTTVRYDSRELVFAAAKSAVDNGNGRHGISAGRVEPAGKGSVIFPDLKPFWVLYDDGGSSEGLVPVEGERWGVKSGSFKLTKNYGGFVVIGRAEEGRVLVIRETAAGTSGSIAKWGKLNQDYDPWETASVTVHVGDPGSIGSDGEETAEVTILAHMPGVFLSQETRVLLIPTDGLSVLNPGEPGYQIIPLECPAEDSSSSGE